MPVSKHYRDRVNTMRGVIQFIVDAKKPLSEWRLYYAVRGNNIYLLDVVSEMKEYGLIKLVPPPRNIPKRRYGEVGRVDAAHPKDVVAVTAKGLKFLKIANEIALLMPTAPWILENAS